VRRLTFGYGKQNDRAGVAPGTEASSIHSLSDALQAGG